ncbi:hypothetical protein NPA31_000495 [Aurantimonas sp. MSK8Z-1]|uniref:hypothetical protein n=1 Tax=Mangrovibrevibacter kandeliae TaxID=2968473 RepID=UPI002118F856|nr:hypothetical protein [Aurantimonas sp. MSK8Z-1]MCW4113436.1 hypothetical protein [Aurantimonas sp. MSK8Z-1]
MIEPTGAELQVFGKVGTTAVTASLRGCPAVREGDVVPFAFPAGGIHLFDKATGTRLD